MTNLAAWANVPPPPERSWTQQRKLEHLEQWRPILKVRQKLASNFRPREGETDVFLHWMTGERLSYPNCTIERLLTDEEIGLLDEDDPVLGVLETGCLSALSAIETLITDSITNV